MAEKFDVLVIGGGHAGIEAALAASRAGAATLLCTLRLDAVGRMPCNPAVGGLAKGQIVREIDALGGEMARAIDAVGIQFRMLNRKKGPAVWAPRAQADKEAYEVYMQDVLSRAPNLTLLEDAVTKLVVENGRIRGAKTAQGRFLEALSVVLTTGTFLRGLLHTGEEQTPGGRAGEDSAEDLSENLRSLGLRLGRLKTGTPPRLARDSIDYARLEQQDGDDPPQPFSFQTRSIDRPQVPCHITHTNPAVHRLITANLHRAPLYTGQIQGTGPRYCPSIETKVERFPDKDGHQIYLEPEGLKSEEVYLNGISTSLPRDLQGQMVRLIPGLEEARILRYGYAVEYDFAPPDQILSNLECKTVDGLFLAGQINGTSGYEEAAGQGLLAGVNAANRILGRDALILSRSEAYIGVMIDDLVTRGVDEPYRMFTSRAEFRLLLRQDNADRRLTRKGVEAGIVPRDRLTRVEAKEEAIARARTLLESTRVGPKTLAALLRRPEVRLASLLKDRPKLADLVADDEVSRQVEIEVKYEGYLERQERSVAKLEELHRVRIPPDLDFMSVGEIRFESREKLSRIRPDNLAQASRIPGVTPADLSVLLVFLESRRKGRGNSSGKDPQKGRKLPGARTDAASP